MEIGLIFLAVMLAGLIGWLLKQSFNTEPWVAEAVEESAYRAPFNASSKLVALATFLAVVTSFFALVMSAYALRMELGDWVPLTEPRLLWVNTGVLVLASIVFQWTRNAAVRDDTARLKPGMILTGALTTAFLAGQFVAWRQLIAAGEYSVADPAAAFFFLITGLHALHILGGMFVWARATVRLFGGSSDIRQSIELSTIYWHFLLLVWLVLFGLMLQT